MRKLLLLALLAAATSHALDATVDPASPPNPTMYRQDVPIVQPSRIALEVGENGAYGAFAINQGAELQFSEWFKIGTSFSGEFDYDHGHLNGPLVARRYSPQFFAGLTWKAQPVMIAVPFGWAHESNGMPLRGPGAVPGARDLDDIQDLAHADWNYLWARLYVTNTSNLTRHELSFNGSVEFRYFGRGLFDLGNDDLSDKAVFVPTSDPVGYQHYDGLRASVGARYEWFALQLSGKLGTRSPSYGSFGAMTSVDLPEEIRKTFPIAPYVAGEYGYGLDMARYFEKDWRVGLGIVVRNPVLHAFWE